MTPAIGNHSLNGYGMETTQQCVTDLHDITDDFYLLLCGDLNARTASEYYNQVQGNYNQVQGNYNQVQGNYEDVLLKWQTLSLGIHRIIKRMFLVDS